MAASPLALLLAQWGPHVGLPPAEPPSRPIAGARRSGPSVTAEVLQNLEIALLSRNVPWRVPLAASAELTGRGYRRPAFGPAIVPGKDPAYRVNQLQIIWPQAPVAWGSASHIAVLPIGEDIVMATTPIATAPFVVLAGDQPSIAPGALGMGGVPANTRRPFGTGRFGQSLFGSYPPEGDVFWITLASIGYLWQPLPDFCGAWTQQDDDCAAWLPLAGNCAAWDASPPFFSGGCR